MAAMNRVNSRHFSIMCSQQERFINTLIFASFVVTGEATRRRRRCLSGTLLLSSQVAVYSPAFVCLFLPHAVNCVRFCFWHCLYDFLSAYEISREPLNIFAPNSRRKRVWSLVRTSLNVKVKGQRSRSPGTNFPY